jgi:hypothetical protein
VPAAHGQLGEDLLQLGHVARHQRDQVVHLAGHEVGRDHLGHRAEHLLERAARPRVVPGQRRRDIGLQREAGRRGVQPGVDHPDHAGLLEVPDAVQRGRRGQPDQPGELDVRHICIRLEQRQQPNVNFVKRNCHIAKR